MKHLLLFAFLFLQIGALAATDGNTDGDRKSKRKKNKKEVKINWMSFEEAWEASKTEPRKIMVDIYTTWCGPCKMMNQKTFTQPDIVEYINDNFYPVKLDAESRDTIQIEHEKFYFVPAGRNGINQLADKLMQDSPGYPTLTFLNEERKVIKAVPGYQDVTKMEKLMYYYNENHYETTPYNLFAKTFKSRIKR